MTNTKRRLGRVLLSLLALVCTAALVAATVYLPGWWFRQQDDALFTQVLERRRQGSHLSPEGEDLYLVRTLHTRNQQLAEAGASAGYTQQDYSLAQLRPALTSTLDAMAKAGVLPAGLCTHLAVLAEGGGTELRYYTDLAGFEQIRCVFGDESGEWNSMGMELEPRTRRVVNFWLTAGHSTNEAQTVDYDADAALKAYRAWLGMDGLDDWQVKESRYYSGLATSEKAQMQLFCLNRGKTLAFGAAPLGMVGAETT